VFFFFFFFFLGLSKTEIINGGCMEFMVNDAMLF
jgi:hypothetical protein